MRLPRKSRHISSLAHRVLEVCGRDLLRLVWIWEGEAFVGQHRPIPKILFMLRLLKQRAGNLTKMSKEKKLENKKFVAHGSEKGLARWHIRNAGTSDYTNQSSRFEKSDMGSGFQWPRQGLPLWHPTSPTPALQNKPLSQSTPSHSATKFHAPSAPLHPPSKTPAA